MSDWYLYLIGCRDGSLYTGISTDVERRLAQHRGEGRGGSRYLKGRGPLRLAFRKRIGSRSLASKLEERIKRLSRGNKRRLIAEPEYFEAIVKRVGTR